MNAPTPGSWRIGRQGSIVADHPVPEMGGSDDVDYYGGHLIAESVVARNAPLLAAAPDLLDAAEATDRALADWQIGVVPGRPEDILALINQVRAAIAKAKGRP